MDKREAKESRTQVFNRGGLSASEAAIAWAILRFSDGFEAAEYLESTAPQKLERLFSELGELSEGARQEVVECWREQDRRWERADQNLEAVDLRFESAVSAPAEAAWARAYQLVADKAAARERPWRRASVRARRAVERIATEHLAAFIRAPRPELRAADYFDVSLLGELKAVERHDLLRRIGVFYLAELSYQQSERALARLRSRLVPADSAWFDYCVLHGGHLEMSGRARLKLLFSQVHEFSADLNAYLRAVALYSIAIAFARRDAQKIRWVLRELEPSLEVQFSGYLADARVSPPEMVWQMQRSLDDYLSYRQRWEQEQAKEMG